MDVGCPDAASPLDDSEGAIVNPNIDALRAVLAGQPENHAIRRLLIEQLVSAGQDSDAVTDYLVLHRAGQLTADERMHAATIALTAGLPDAATALLDAGTDAAPADWDASADTTPAADTSPTPIAASPEPTFGNDLSAELSGPAEVRGDDFIDTVNAAITFDDVGGLRDVKQAIDRLIIQPLARPELFEKYGKSAGGGVLLYGPPGCGKTMIARATAGQCGLPFYNLRIEDLVDPYFGVTEQRIAAAFEAARELRPCILFIDELDALGYARSQQNSERGRAMVEVLLQQLDSIGSDSTGLLVLAASNEPWDIDGALMRPGRFDRTIFVPPPDDEARAAIINRRLQTTPHQGIDIKRLVKATPLFSGADLSELVERGIEEVLEDAMATGTEPPLTQAHLDRATAQVKATTLTWLQRARNHADFGNVGGRWDDVKAFLKQRSVAKQLRLQDPKD